jgi:UDP-N-acetylglucosamine 1-carboxyvinyltransferase
MKTLLRSHTINVHNFTIGAKHLSQLAANGKFLNLFNILLRILPIPKTRCRMTQYEIRGGRPLNGEVWISGAKNAAVAIIPATLIVNGVCRLENIPKISDVTVMLEIMRDLGANVKLIDDTTIEIDTTKVTNRSTPYEAVRKLRASYYLVGAMLSRFGSASVAQPGGCNFGVRPIDQHEKGFEALGAEVSTLGGFISANAGNGLKGATIYLDMASVGATINIMLAAVLAEGMTIIENSAREPHIVDLANFLNCMGASIRGAGTDVIKSRGVESLHGGTYSIIPVQIEAGTYLAAVAAAGGNVMIQNVIPRHLECITAKLCELGVEIEEFDEAVRVRRESPLRRANVKTLPYPGFPTDMQPQMTAVLSIANGTSIITEGVWDKRYRYVDELRRLGAHITVDGKVAVVEGVSALSGAPMHASDLRAGAALVVAALAANGLSCIDGIDYIERGYENMVDKLKALGADIERIEYPDSDPAFSVPAVS